MKYLCLAYGDQKKMEALTKPEFVARDLNEAIRIASMHPAARLGEQGGWALEIRPIADGCHQ